MRKALTVAWREFKHTAMTKAFLFGAIVMPLLMMGLFIVVVPLLTESNNTPLVGSVVVIAEDDVIEEITLQIELGNTTLAEVLEKLPDVVTKDPLASALLASAPKSDITIIAGKYSDIDSIKKQVREGVYKGVIVVPDSSVLQHEDDDGIEIFIPSSFSPNHTDILTSATSRAVVDARLKRLSHDPEAIRSLIRRPRATATRLSNDGGEIQDNEFARRIIPMAFMMLLWIATFTSGQYLLTTTIEEKSNKVMEVLLSAVSPMQLLSGKILGQAGVSAVILLMYGSAVMAGLLAFALGDLVPVIHLVLFAIYFVIAYFMIATIMAAVGSAVSELRDAQSLMGPIMLVMVIPMIIWPVLSEHPNGLLATITSFTPPLLPFVMILRVTASTEPIAVWQIALSIFVGILSVVAMIWICGRIFRIGVLMQGKPPSILQLAKWIRQG